MQIPYSDQLRAIREMLANPASEIVQEGYDLLFKLWLKNTDSNDFYQDLIAIAVEHDGLIQELKDRLHILVIKDEITDAYLQQRLKFLDSEVSKFKTNSLNRGGVIESLSKNENEFEKANTIFEVWKLALIGIFIIAVGLIIFLPGIFQKVTMLAIAVNSTIAMPYIFSKKHRAITTKIAGVKLNYSFTKYLAIGDENIIDLSVENSNETEFGGAITLVFDDKDSLITPVANQSLSAKVEVPYFGREARQFKFILKNKPLDGSVNYHFQVISSNGSRYNTDREFFLISPIPYLRSTWAWLFGSAGVGALIIAVLWEQLEKLLGLE